MGISTLQSYKGAQIFEAVGLADDLVKLAFKGTASRVSGIDLEALASEMLRLHRLGYPDRDAATVAVLPNPGDFHWRAAPATRTYGIPNWLPTCNLLPEPTAKTRIGRLPNK